MCVGLDVYYSEEFLGGSGPCDFIGGVGLSVLDCWIGMGFLSLGWV